MTECITSVSPRWPGLRRSTFDGRSPSIPSRPACLDVVVLATAYCTATNRLRGVRAQLPAPTKEFVRIWSLLGQFTGGMPSSLYRHGGDGAFRTGRDAQARQLFGKIPLPLLAFSPAPSLPSATSSPEPSPRPKRVTVVVRVAGTITLLLRAKLTATRKLAGTFEVSNSA